MPFEDAKYPPRTSEQFVVVLGRLDCGFRVYGPFASVRAANGWIAGEGVGHGVVIGHACWVSDLADPASLGKEVVCLT
jgi:hypothetical protein